jgi:hypothetical protein
MASEPVGPLTELSRELIALMDAVHRHERERETRLEAKLAEFDALMQESSRVQKLITGGAANREARLRALENMVEVMAAERSRYLQPRPLDIPAGRVDPSIVDMRLDGA